MWNQDLESEVDEGEKVRLSRMDAVRAGEGATGGVECTESFLELVYGCGIGV